MSEPCEKKPTVANLKGYLEDLRGLARGRAKLQCREDEIQHEINLLRAERYKIVYTSDKRTTAIANYYAKAWNLACAARVYERLPREVRNMIYEELILLCEEESGHNIWSCYTRRDGLCIEHDYQRENQRCWKAKLINIENDYPHYFNKSFMGNEFTTELCEIYYQSASVYLIHQNDVQPYLEKDLVFGTSCIPKLHIRNIRVWLELDLFDSQSGHKTYVPDQKNLPKQDYVNAVNKLEPLKELALRPDSAWTIFVCADSRRTLAKFKDVLRTFVYDGEDRGFPVWVESNKTRVDRITNFDVPQDLWVE